MKGPRSFALRIVIWFVVLGVAPAAVMAAIAFASLQSDDEDHALRDLRTAARAQAAVLAAGVAPADMDRILDGDGGTFLVGADGVILTGPDRGRHYVRAADGIYVNHAGLEVLGASTPVGDRRVVAEMPRSEVTGPVRRLAARLLLIGGIAFVVASLALIVVARRIERGGAAMVASLEDAGRGEFGGQVDPPLRGPVGDVARALNDMQLRLADREAQIVSQRQELFCQQCELEKLNTQIRAADQVKGEFVANMSHEVRTPLHAVLSLSRVLLDEKSGDLNDEQRRQVGIIERNGKALLALLGDILDFSKIEAGRMDVVVSDVAPGGALAAVREAVLPLAEEKGLLLKLEAAADLPVIETDAEKLHRALLNLAHNAVKFTDEGSVTLAAEAAGDGGVRFLVSDTGVGIPPEKIPTIFEPFRQVDASATRAVGGTGLGLTITQSLVEHLNGRLGVESGPGQGTTFAITLPPRLELAPDGTILVLGASQPSAEPVWAGIRAAGFKGGQVVCGREVHNALSRDDVGAIAIDVGMFERDGLDVFRELAARQERPVLFGFWVTPDRERGRYLGRLELVAGDNGAMRLELPDAGGVSVPRTTPTEDQREAARAWARELAGGPAEPLDGVVRALVAEADHALRQTVGA